MEKSVKNDSQTDLEFYYQTKVYRLKKVTGNKVFYMDLQDKSESLKITSLESQKELLSNQKEMDSLPKSTQTVSPLKDTLSMISETDLESTSTKMDTRTKEITRTISSTDMESFPTQMESLTQVTGKTVK